MLARLEAVSGVQSAEADHDGELLRVRVDDPTVFATAHSALRDLGYDATVADPPPATDLRWFSSATVREVSREEAEIVAERVTTAFSQTQGVDRAELGAIEATIADALYAVFTAHSLGAGAERGALRALCARAVEDAVRGLAGSDPAREIGAIVERDLAATDTGGAATT